jgi:integrase
VFCRCAGSGSSEVLGRDWPEVTRVRGLPDLSFRFHALRHHAVSALIAEGARITLVSKVAGHATPDVTLRVYSHLLGEDIRAAADIYDPLREAG